MQCAFPQNKQHTSNQTQTYFCLGLLPWSLAHLAHIICWRTHTSGFRIDFYPFPAQPPHRWCPSVMGGTVQLPPLVRQQGAGVLQQSGLMGPLQLFQLHPLSSKCAPTYLHHRASCQLAHLHFLCWSPFGGIQGCIAEQRWLGSDLCIPLWKASCFNILPLQNRVPLHNPTGQLGWQLLFHAYWVHWKHL